MFEFVTMPLTHFWDLEEQSPQELQEALLGLQRALSEQLGREITWSEDVEEDSYEADLLDPYSVYSLKAMAAWLDNHDDIEGFSPGVEPWAHPAILELDEDGTHRYPQLLHSDADVMVFAPVVMPDVYYLADGDEEDAEGDEEEFAVGSLQSLFEELERLNEFLGLEGDIEQLPDGTLFDVDADPLAAPKYAWAVLHAAVRKSLAQKLPLICFFDPDLAEEEEWDEDEDEG